MTSEISYMVIKLIFLYMQIKNMITGFLEIWLRISYCENIEYVEYIARADPGFQVRGAHLKKLRRAEGGAKIFGIFRVKNHDFTPKNHIFSIAEGGANIFEVFRVKNHDFTPKNLIFSNFRGRARFWGRMSAPFPMWKMLFFS